MRAFGSLLTLISAIGLTGCIIEQPRRPPPPVIEYDRRPPPDYDRRPPPPGYREPGWRGRDRDY